MSQFQFFNRIPYYHDGTEVTSRRMADLLPKVLSSIGKNYQQNSLLVLGMWPEIVGPQLALMSQAVSFVEGVLTVKVRNSIAYSLLNQNEKGRLLKALRQKFPTIEIKNICFRMG